ncbi:MAG: class II aldolase/adducin family protein [Anaerolineales bacterium]|nr:class II aldolase/adducin family protein [Anaerolineales bacterium]
MDLSEILHAIGQVGQRLCEISACEGAAGNISIYLGKQLEPSSLFPLAESISLPVHVPEIAGGHFLVTGSGRRLRELLDDPQANLGLLRINPGGDKGTLFTSPLRKFTHLTSEFNTHLAVHYDHILTRGLRFHALVHAQPIHLTFLSHIPAYQDWLHLNQRVLCWQPEAILNLPEGIGYLPFIIPGSTDLMHATIDQLRRHQLVLWGKHGVMARSDHSVKKASDLVEYAETGARYEYMKQTVDKYGTGLSPEEIRAVCTANNIHQNIF